MNDLSDLTETLIRVAGAESKGEAATLALGGFLTHAAPLIIKRLEGTPLTQEELDEIARAEQMAIAQRRMADAL